MKIEMFDKVLLKTGETAYIVEIYTVIESESSLYLVFEYIIKVRRTKQI